MQFGCPHSRDPRSKRAGTGGPAGGTSFTNLLTGQQERRISGGNIKDENIDRTSNSVGTLSMANTGAKNTGGSQFFLNVATNSNLDWFSPGESKHPVFGQVFDKKSLDLCVKISKVQTRDDNPIKPIQVRSVAIEMPAASSASGGSAAAAPVEVVQYYYLDHTGKEQGPFGIDAMRGWYSGGHLPATQQVRKHGVTAFTPLWSDGEITQVKQTGANVVAAGGYAQQAPAAPPRARQGGGGYAQQAPAAYAQQAQQAPKRFSKSRVPDFNKPRDKLTGQQLTLALLAEARERKEAAERGEVKPPAPGGLGGSNRYTPY